MHALCEDPDKIVVMDLHKGNAMDRGACELTLGNSRATKKAELEWLGTWSKTFI